MDHAGALPQELDGQQIGDLFAQALQLPPDQRTAFLDHAPIADDEKYEVTSLLAAHEAMG